MEKWERPLYFCGNPLGIVVAGLCVDDEGVRDERSGCNAGVAIAAVWDCSEDCSGASRGFWVGRRHRMGWKLSFGGLKSPQNMGIAPSRAAEVVW